MRTVLVGIVCLTVGFGIGQKGKEPELKLEPQKPYKEFKKNDQLYINNFNAILKTYEGWSYSDTDRYSVTQRNGFVIIEAQVNSDGDILDGKSNALLTKSGHVLKCDPRARASFGRLVNKYKKEAEEFDRQWEKFNMLIPSGLHWD